MKETWMPPVHAANLVANSGNALYREKSSVLIQIALEFVPKGPINN